MSNNPQQFVAHHHLPQLQDLNTNAAVVPLWFGCFFFIPIPERVVRNFCLFAKPLAGAIPLIV